MDPMIITAVAVIVALVLLIMAFRSGKLLFKLALGVVFLVFLVVVIFSLIIFSDNLDVRTNFEKESNLFIVVNNDKVVSALYMKPFDDTQGFTIDTNGVDRYDKYFEKLTSVHYDSFTNAYKEDELDSLLVRLKLDRIQIIYTEAFFEVEGVLLSIEGVQLSVSDIGLAMESDNPVGVLSTLVAEEKGVSVDSIRPLIQTALGDDPKPTLQILFMAKLAKGQFKSLNDVMPIFRLNGFEAYPETPFFSALNSGSGVVQSFIDENDSGDINVNAE